MLTISIVPDATQIRKYHLTKQEVCILEYILKGKSNKEIAAALFISSHTVKNHIYNLFQKTSVGSRYELISRFREQK